MKNTKVICAQNYGSSRMHGLLFLGIILICQLFSKAYSQELQIKNCNSNIGFDAVQISNNENKLNADNSISETILPLDSLSKINFHIDVETNVLELNEVVISSTKWPLLRSYTSNHIRTILRNQIELENPQTAADLLRISGKVFMQKSQQAGGSPMIRGFSTNRLLYSVDGVRMNSAIFRGGNIQNVINLDPFVLSKTEILMGPGSVVYGSDAIGGVMNFQTLQLKFSANEHVLIKGNAITRFSSANKEKTGHLDLHFGWKKFAFLSSISSWDFDDLQQGKYGPSDYLKTFYVNDKEQVLNVVNANIQTPSAYSQINTLHKVQYNPNSKWQLNFDSHFSKTSNYARYDRLNQSVNGKPINSVWNYGPQKWILNNFIVTNNTANKFYDEIRLQLSQQFFEESRITRKFQSNQKTERTENVSAYAINLDLRKSIKPNISFNYGYEWVLNSVESKGTAINIKDFSIKAASARYPKATWQSQAAYLTNIISLNTSNKLNSGIRYSQYIMNADFSNNQAFFALPYTSTTINNGALTFSTGFLHTFSESSSAKLNIGSGFRAPNVDDLGKIFDTEPQTVTIPNPNLKAEYSLSFDFSITKNVFNNLSVELTVFKSILYNSMLRRPFSINGIDSLFYENDYLKTLALQNLGKTYISGLESSIIYNITQNLYFSSNLNFQKGIDIEDGVISQSRHSVPFFGSLRLAYKREKVQTSVISNFQGKITAENMPFEERNKDEIYAKDKAGNNYAPSWNCLDLKMSYHMIRTLDLNIGIENVLNKRYRPFSSGISSAGRNFIVSSSYKF